MADMLKMRPQNGEDDTEWLMCFFPYLAGVQTANRWGPDEIGGLL